MTESASPSMQDQAVMDRPHLAFVIECLGLASLAGNSPHQEILPRLGRCLKTLVATYGLGDHSPGTPNASLVMWLDKAMQEFSCLQEKDLSALLEACSGNTMPDWLKDKVRTELGETVTDLITVCLQC